MSFIQDFKDFSFKGNLIDIAVGIITGTAAAEIVLLTEILGKLKNRCSLHS